MFTAIAVPMTYYGYEYKSGTGTLPTTISTLSFLGIASIILPGTEPSHFPRRLAKYFTRIERTPSELRMFASWKSSMLVIGPLAPIITAIMLAGLFDH